MATPSMPAISIVMPCRDSLEHLPLALGSIRETFANANYEIIVADGGSEDGTLGYLRAQDVHLIEGPDRSLYEGLNKALAAARGRFLIWLNADDRLAPSMAGLVEVADRQNLDLATGEASLEIGDTQLWLSQHHGHRMDFASVLFGNPTINSRVFLRDALMQAGHFRTDVGLGADREFLLRLLKLQLRRGGIPELVYRNGVHDGSRTMGGTWRSYLAVHEAFVQLGEAIGATHADSADHGTEIAAFTLISSAAATRAALFQRLPFEALKYAGSTLSRAMSPQTLVRAGKRWNMRQQSSGW